MKKIRVLHRIHKLARGGIETWLINLVRILPSNIQFDFAVDLKGDDYENIAREYGCHIYYSKPISRFKKRLQIIGLAKKSDFLHNLLRMNDYDVFHIHGEEFMGDALKEAAEAGVPVRIAHCHSTVLARGKRNFEMVIRSLRFKSLDRHYILKYATDICAVSNEAGKFLMGNWWEKDPRCKLLYCGIPIDKFSFFENFEESYDYRKFLGIPKNAIVVGHVGSMGPTPTKNHLFLLKIFHALSQRSDRYYLYLAGDGPQRPIIEREVWRLGLKNRVLMPGICKDIPKLMAYGFDVFLLPSLYEGLPIVGLEAIAAGLYVVCSDRITRDFTERFRDRVSVVSLNENPNYWADVVEAGVKKRISPSEGIDIIRKSPFNINSSMAELINLYQKRLFNISR